MLYSDGRAPVKTEQFCADFYESHPDITGMSADQFDNLVGRSNERYQSLPYHGYAHPMQVMWDAAALISQYGIKLPAESRAGLFVGIAYHDMGESFPAEERQHKSPEQFSADSMYEDRAKLGLDDRVLDIARSCIVATAPGIFKRRAVETRVMVRADIANVLSGDFERMAEATRLLVDERMLKDHQDHDDFLIESFIRNTTAVLGHYLQTDLHVHPKDEWSKQSTNAMQKVNTQIPPIARNHFNGIARSLGHQMQDGVYPYRISQGSSFVVTPAPWTDSPGPSTTS
jgi:hypothetical protein